MDLRRARRSWTAESAGEVASRDERRLAERIEDGRRFSRPPGPCTPAVGAAGADRSDRSCLAHCDEVGPPASTSATASGRRGSDPLWVGLWLRLESAQHL